MARFATRCAVLVLVLLPRGADAQGSPLDPDFGDEGTLTVGYGESSYQVGRHLLVLDHGRFIVGGESFAGNDGAATLSRFLPSGELDGSFGDGGTLLDNFDSGYDATTEALVVDPQERIVALYRNIPGALVVRRHADGSLDESFGIEGVAEIPFQDAYDLKIQPDGSLVVVGRINNGNDNDFAICRFTSSGVLDSSFGPGGTVLVDFGSGAGDLAHSLAIRPDGRILVSGSSGHYPAIDFALAQLLPDGTMDATFGVNGLSVLSISDDYDNALDVAILPDGRIVQAGAQHFSGSGSDDGDFAVVRYLTDGTPDASFNGDGIATLDLSPHQERAYRVVPLPSGAILLAGYTWHEPYNDGTAYALIRYTETGQLDDAFGDGGIVRGMNSYPSFFHDVISLPTGKFLCVGGGANGAFLLSRFLPEGSLDPSFGDGGTVLKYGLGPGLDEPQALFPQGDRFVVAATNQMGGTCHQCLTLSRHTADGHLDPTYGGGGVVTVPDLYAFDAVTAQPDDKLVTVNYTAEGLSLRRFTRDGAVDPTFGEAGVLSVLIPFEENVYPRALFLQPDGKFVVAGRHHDEPDDVWAAVRILLDGTVDPQFGQQGIALTPIAGSPSSAISLPDGRTVLGGTVTGEFCLVALLADGELDPNFGMDGVVFTSFGSADASSLSALATQPDGLIVTAGRSTNRFLFARYSPQGRLDPTFGNEGRTTLSIPMEDVRLGAFTVQPNGKLVAVGSGSDHLNMQSGVVVVRLLNNGQSDATFGEQGLATALYDHVYRRTAGVGVLDDGLIVTVGTIDDGFQTDYALAGFLPVTPTASEPILNLPTIPLALGLPSPNPANERSTLSLTVTSPQVIRVTLTDMLGREITVVYDGPVSWTEPVVLDVATSDLPSGVYVLRVVGENVSATRMLTVVH